MGRLNIWLIPLEKSDDRIEVVAQKTPSSLSKNSPKPPLAYQKYKTLQNIFFYLYSDFKDIQNIYNCLMNKKVLGC